MTRPSGARPVSSYGTRSSPRTNVARPDIPQRAASQRSRIKHRRITSIHSFPEPLLTDSADSRPDTPIVGLENHELRKNYETATKMLEISCRVVAKYINADADRDEVLAAIKDVLKEDVTSFPLTANFRVILGPFPSWSMAILSTWLRRVALVPSCTIKLNAPSLLLNIFWNTFGMQCQSLLGTRKLETE